MQERPPLDWFTPGRGSDVYSPSTRLSPGFIPTSLWNLHGQARIARLADAYQGNLDIGFQTLSERQRTER